MFETLFKFEFSSPSLESFAEEHPDIYAELIQQVIVEVTGLLNATLLFLVGLLIFGII